MLQAKVMRGIGAIGAQGGQEHEHEHEHEGFWL